MRKMLPLTAALLAALLAGCGNGGGDDDGDGDAQRLTAYRAAIPEASVVLAPVPTGGAAPPVALAINGLVQAIVDVLKAVVDQQPTLCDSTTREYFWGPVDNPDGVGTAAAYIREEGEGADFRYTYALLRGIGGDVATFTPVIWGGATPDPSGKERGVGVTLWDFEANHGFIQSHGTGETTSRGRFVAACGKNAANVFDPTGDLDAETTLGLAVFRAFVPEDDPEVPPRDLDYLYGRHVGADQTTVDFLEFEAGIDIHADRAPELSLPEKVDLRMAFLNQGWGRADVEATGGDLTPTQQALGTECWNNGLLEQFLEFQLLDAEASQFLVQLGDTADCGPVVAGTPLFSRTLDELKIPSFEDVDPALRAKLEQVALTGVPPED